MSRSASQPSSAFESDGLAATAAGVALGVALEECEPRRLDDYDLVDAIAACERQVAHLQAVQARLIQELSGRQNYAFCVACEDTEIGNEFHTHDRADAVGQEISAALTWTPNEAKNHAGLAIELVEEHRSVYRALADGKICWGKARIIVRGVSWLDDPWLQAEVEDRLLEVAPGMTERQLHRRLNRMLNEADPKTANKRRAEGRKNRRVCSPLPDDDVTGIASMTLVGPAEDLVALYTAVDAAARSLRAAGDTRNLNQLRFDLLCQVGWNALSTGVLAGSRTCGSDAGTGGSSACADGSGACICGPGTEGSRAGDPGAPRRSGQPAGVRLANRHGRPATVQVTMPITALLGVDDEPCELAGYGPIPAEAARRIAGNAVFRRLLTDPVDGRLLEYGRTTYTPPRALEDFVLARDSRCVFPTCDTPSDVCDIDHGIPWEDGGTTGASNNHPLSRGCHVGKTLHGWSIEHTASGGYQWRSPSGHTYTVPPEAVGPIRDLARPPRRPPAADPGNDPPPF